MSQKKLAAALLIFSLALTLCSGASVFPSSLSTQKGTVSSTPISALRVKDQSGSQDTWNNYVEFYGSSTAYQGTFTFDVSSVGSVSSYALNVNFKGPKVSVQKWQFEWLVPATNTWIIAGDNAAAASWVWSSLAFPGVPAFSTLVNQGKVQLRFSSLTAGDDCDLDFLELFVNSGSATPAPTSAPTAAPTTRPTAAPTSAPTTRPTTAPTSTPTTRPTSAPTAAPTTAPTTKPTSAPTSTPTTRPTSAPTTTPTTAPTTKPTSAPTSSPGGRLCPAGKRYVPGPGTTWQWQLSGTVDTSFNVQAYDIDMEGASATLITSLHNAGRAVICYIDTAYEPGRDDSSQFTSAVLGNGIDGWPGQKWVDIRSPIVRNIMKNRLAKAAGKKCDAVEMDDVDAYLNNPGFPLTYADQLDFNKFLATEAHKLDLGIALKNDLDQVADLASSFDFAVNEQCYQYGECDVLSTFVNQGKAVFGVEYELATSAFCSKANAKNFSWLKKNLDLDAPLTQCCTTCSGTFSCVASPAARSVEFEEEAEAVAEVSLVEEAALSEPIQNEELVSSGSKVVAFASLVVVALFAAL